MHHTHRPPLLGILLCLQLVSPTIVESARAAEPASDRASEDLRAWQRAQEALEAGDHRAAIGALELAHKLAPDNPIYQYHLGYVQERLGMNAEALRSLSSVLEKSGLDAELRALATSRVAMLRPVADKAVLRLKAVPPGTRIQVDQTTVWDSRPDLALAPGKHFICQITEESRNVRCWERELAVGRRHDWPLPETGEPRGTLRWPGDLGASRILLEGLPLAVDLSRLRTIELPAHRWRGGVTYGTTDDPFDIDVVPGGEHPVPTRGAIVAPVIGPGGGPGTVHATHTRQGAGAGPWVVLGVGVAAAGAGLGLMLKGASDRSAVEKSREAGRDDDRTVSTLTYSQAKSQWNAANDKTTIGSILLGVGGGAAAGGLIWWLVGRGGDEGISASVWTGPGESGVSIRGHFR